MTRYLPTAFVMLVIVVAAAVLDVAWSNGSTTVRIARSVVLGITAVVLLAIAGFAAKSRQDD